MRRLVLSIVIIQGAVAAAYAQDAMASLFDGKSIYVFSAIAIVLSPVMTLGVIGLQIVNPASDTAWPLPTSESNPLKFGNPLAFGHFGAQVGVATGLGGILASTWGGWHFFVMGFTNFLVGLGWYGGLLWCIRLAGDKVPPGSTRPRLFDL